MFKIELHNHKGKTIIQGSFGIFVPCGSQLAYWQGFPANISFTLNSSMGTVYNSFTGPDQISNTQGTIDYYSGLPCNEIVTSEFSLRLEDVFGSSLPTSLKGSTLFARYLGTESNILVIDSDISV